MSKFREGLRVLINQNSMENGSNTPDLILVGFLEDCLYAFDKAVKRRSEWRGDETNEHHNTLISARLEEAHKKKPL